MIPTWLRNWSHSPSTSRRPRSTSRRRLNRWRELNIESLETRLAPATFRWDGGASDNLWMSGLNWEGDVAPTPADDTILDFPAGAGVGNKANINNFPADSVFGEIRFTGDGFSLTGNGIQSSQVTATIGVANQLGLNSIKPRTVAGTELPLFFNVATGTNLTVSSSLFSGAATDTFKFDPGTLTLSGTSPNLLGPVTVAQGVLSLRSSGALGATSQGTSVSTDAALQLENGAGTVPEPLILNGLGVTNTGALRNLSGNNTWSGPITLQTSVVDIGADTGTVLTITGVVGDGGASNALTKVGAGRLDLNQANTYGGETTVSTGILGVRNAAALGLSSMGTVVSNGATLELQTGVTSGEGLTLNGTGIANAGALQNTSGNNTWTGPVTLGTNTSIGSVLNTELTISGSIGDNGNNFSLTKAGPGRLALSNANTFGGAVNVNAGTVVVQNAAALGSGAGNTVVADNAMLEIQTNVVGENLTITGQGVGSQGALFNASGSNTWSGNITLATGASIGAADTLSLTISGIIGESTAAATLNKTGLGKVILQNSNTYTGTTTVSQGILNIQNALALGPGSSTTVQSGASLEIQGVNLSVNEALSLTGSGVANTGALRNVSGNNTWAGTVTLTALGASIGVDAGQNLSINGVISETGGAATLTKELTGTLILNAANTYTGLTRINAGLVSITNNQSLGTTAAGTQVLTGASLRLDGTAGNLAIGAEALSLNGNGVGGIGALESITGTNTWAGTITLDTDSRISVDAGQLSLNGVIGQGATAAGFNKTGLGELVLNAANTYAGTTTVNAGVVTLLNGSGLGATTAGTTVVAGAKLQVNGVNVGAEALSLAGDGGDGTGALLSDAGTNSWAGDVTLTANATVGVTAGQLTLSGIVGDSGSNFDLSKARAGRLVLGNANTYGGATNVNAGQLQITNSSALGGTTAGTFVNGTAVLEVQNNISVGTEALFLNSTAAGGSLQSVAGTNSWAGIVTLQTDSSIAVTAGQFTISGAITESGGTRNLTKLGAGTLVLTSANSYSGFTTVSAGILRIANAQALGGATFGTTVVAGATLELSGVSVANETLSIIGAGVGGIGALNNLSGNNTWSGTITLTGDASIGVATSADTLDLTGAINDGGNNFNLSKVGVGTLALSNANAFGGLTNVNAGTLSIRNSSALGGTTNGTVVAAGATLALQVSVAGEPLSITGIGVGGGGALRNAVGTNTWSGTVTMTGDATIGVANTTQLTITGIISETGGARALTKSDLGKLVLTRANTYTGNTTVQAGILNIQDSAALGGVANGTTVANNAALELEGTGLVITEPLNITGTGVNNTGALRNVSGNNQVSAGVTLTAPSAAVGVDPSQVLTISGIIGQAGTAALGKVGTGELILTNANTYDGLTTISAGVLTIQNALALGTTAAGTTVSNDATLRLAPTGPNLTVTNELLTLNGNGFTGGGALRNTAGDNTWNGSILLNTNSLITVAAGTLRLSGTVGDGGTNSGFTKNGTGTLFVTGTNTYGGTTTISEGRLNLQNTQGLGQTTAGTTVSSGATLELQGVSVAGESLSIAGLGVNGEGALLSLTGSVTWSGNITLAANSRIGVTGTQLTVSGVVGDGGGNFNLSKVGAGRLVLSSSNTYGGTTNVEAGVLVVTNNQALGLTTGGTVVTAGAILELQNVNVAGEPLTLNGNGVSNSGALLAATGGNTWSGPVTLASDAGIGANPNVLLTVSGSIGETGGTHNLSKEGTGTVVFSAANTYSGITTVRAGVLEIQNALGLGTAAGGTIVENNAALGVTNANVAAEPLTLNGTGGATLAGALRNLSGNNSWGGPITLQTDSNIGAANGTDFTINGVIDDAGANRALTKVGLGRIILTAANTYGGLTNVNAGALRVNNSLALGMTTSGTVVASGAALELTISVSGEALTLNGNGIGTTGALRSVAGTQAWSGPVTLASSSAIGADAGTTLTVSGGIGGGNLALLVKVGTGTVVFPFANTYDGLTLVVSGILNIRDPLALGTGTNPTQVSPSASLQIQDGITVTSESLQLSGNGFNNRGALENVSSSNTWGASIVLAADASIGVTGAGDALTISGPISESQTGLNLAKIGPGTLVFSGVGNNQYTGTTTVTQGILRLSKTGATAVPGPLVIGTSTATAARVELTANNQISNTAAVTVNSDGQLLLQDNQDTIGPLTVALGSVNLGAGATGLLTVNGLLTMTGGTISTGGGGTLALGGNVNATSVNPGAVASVIDGGGFVSLGSSRTFTIGDGPALNDLAISAGITGAAQGLTKDGAGRMLVSGTNTYSGTTTLNAGTLIVDAVQVDSPVVVTNGVLGGSGTVNTINSTGGTVAPGASTGILNSASVTFSGATTYAVEINGPTVGTEYDQLNVTGTATLGGATLQVALPGNVSVGTVFTIIKTTAGVSGTFQGLPEGTVFFVNGNRLQISYLANGAKDVTLTRIGAETMTTLVSSQNPSVFGQSVTFTATVTPVPPATGIPTGLVRFFVDGSSMGDFPLNGSGVAQFTTSTLIVGSRLVVATYLGDVTFNTSTSNTLTQVVNKSASSTALTSVPNPSTFGQAVTLTATITAAPPGSGTPTGSVEFFDGIVSLGTAPLTGGVGSIQVSTLTAGSHSLTAVYSGDSGFGVSTSPSVTQVVNKAATSTTLDSALNPSVFGQTVALTATVTTVAPGMGTPVGSVQFFDGIVSLGTVALNGAGMATLQISTLTGGTHSITAQYLDSANFSTSTSPVLSQVVNPATTSTMLSNVPSTSVFGQPVTLTATVTVGAPSPATASGTVEFFAGALSLGTAPTNGSGVATLIVTNIPVGVQSLTATFLANTNFQGSVSTPVSQTVTQASTTTSIANVPSNSVFGQVVTLTATVSPVAPSTAPVNGTVEFFDGLTSLGQVAVTNGTGVLLINTLTVGSHTLSATFLASTNYASSTSGTVTQTVDQAATTTSLVNVPSTSVFGQPVTLTATVAAVAPSSTTPTGTVQFFNGAQPLGTASLTGGSAAIVVSNLPVGTLSLTAVFLANTSFIGSTSPAVTQTVNLAPTTTVLANVPSTSVFGQPVTLTATVSANAPSIATVTGTVEFFDGVQSLGTSPVTGGVGTLIVSSLSVGSHSLTAVFLTNASFLTSTSTAVTQTVNQASTSTVLMTAPNPSVNFETVTFTATVSAVAPGGGIPSGLVEFLQGTTVIASAPLNASGVATISAPLTTGVYPFTAHYLGNVSFIQSTSAVVTQVVNPASTSTALMSAPNPSVFGNQVTLTATVTATAPGGGTPQGTVQFFDGVTPLGTSSLNGVGVATFQISTLSGGTHSLTATYVGNSDYLTSTSAPVSQVVTGAPTTTSLGSVPNPSVFGQPVTLTATVAAINPAIGPPTGIVEFFDNTTSLGTAPLNGSGVATFVVSTLTAANHPLTAMYLGSGDFLVSTSSTINQVVNQAATSTTMTNVPDTSVYGQPVTLTATVTASAPSLATVAGTVQFFAGLTSLGTATVTGGVATLVVNNIDAGVQALTAVFLTNANFLGSTSPSVTQTVSTATTTTTLTNTPSTNLFGQIVALTATVTANAPSAIVPSGSVEFFDGGTSLGIVTLSGTGTATLNISTLSVGTHTLTSTFLANANFQSSTGGPVTQTVNQASTTTSLTPSANPAVIGQTVTLTATVTPVSPAGGIPTGTVEFLDNGVVIAMGTLNASGTATANVSFFVLGTHPLTANYVGTASYAGSLSGTVDEVINQSQTNTVLGPTPNPSVFGQVVTLTATVSAAAPGSGVPQGSVQFFDGVTFLGSGNVDATGIVSITVSTLSAGSHPLTAVYQGNTNYAGSTSPVANQIVNQAATATVVTSAPNPSVFGQPVLLTATVSTLAPGAGTADGNVQFFDGGIPLGIGTLNGSGVATLFVSGLNASNHSITAQYVGSSNFSGSTSAAINQSVTQASTSTSLTNVPDTTVFGQPVTLTATVSALAPSLAVVTGIVQFFDGAVSVGTAPLSGGVATLVVSSLSVGTHSLTAQYLASANFLTSTSAAQTQTVGQASTSTVLGNAPTTSVFGQPVLLVAGVLVNAPGAGTPSGNVEFLDGSTVLGTAPVDGLGFASLTTTAIPVGVRSLTARYVGDTSFQGSTSAPVTQTVGKADTTTTATTSVNPSDFGQLVTFTATVTANAPSVVVPTGFVAFAVDGTVVANVPLDSTGKAVFPTTSLAVGTRLIEISFVTNDSFNGSSAAPISQVVNKAATTTAVTTSKTPTVFGEQVTFTATVTPVPPAGGFPTGIVTFFEGAVAIGTGTLSGGIATFSTTTLSIGSHVISAAFGGDGSYLPSATTTSVTQTVNQASTTTTVTSSVNPSVFGQDVTFTATVAAAAPGSGTPGGQVVFRIDGVDQAPVTLTSTGSATIVRSDLAVGPHTIDVSYSGDSRFLASATAAPLTQIVNPANTAVSLATSHSPSVFGELVTFTATVTTLGPGAGIPTGFVQFTVDGSSTFVVPVDSLGQAELFLLDLTVGNHTIAAAYLGDTSFNPSAPGLVNQTVTKAGSTTQLFSSVNPSVIGENVIFTALVVANSPSFAVPDGLVTFTIDGVAQPPVALDSLGQATFSTSSLTLGAHLVSVVYAGSNSFNPSGPALLTQNVALSDTITSDVVSSLNPSFFGQSVTFTATVTATLPGAGIPPGIVTFLDAGTPIGTGTLVGGVATFTTSSLTPGTYDITARYEGSSDFRSSTSATPLVQNVLQAVTNTTVTSSSPTSVFGQPVTFTATVSVTNGVGIPDGQVRFVADGVPLGFGTLTNGVATLTTSGLTVGAHSITAEYQGTVNFAGSTSLNLGQTVTAANSTISLGSSANPSVTGQPIVFTATVSAVAPGAGTPSGTVTFTIDGIAQPPVNLAGGQATFTTSTLTVGAHTVSVTYSGDASFNGSGPANLGQTVNPAITTVGLSANPATAVTGQGVTLTAVVSVTAPGVGSPTGTVSFFDDGAPLGTAPLVGNTATLPVPGFPSGNHNLTATYNGDASFAVGTSPALVYSVTRANTTTSVNSSDPSPVVGQPLTFTATVAVVAPGAGTPSGQVSFLDGSTVIGTAMLSAGTASLTISTLGVGSHNIAARFDGDLQFNGSISAPLAQSIGKAATTTSLATSGTPTVFGEEVTLSATISVTAPGVAIPSGQVVFFADGSPIGVGFVQNGVATFTTTSLPVGLHNLTATYNGNGDTNGSTSNTVVQTVNQGSTASTLVSSASPAVFGQNIVFTATVAPVAPATGIPSGSVQFTIDGNTQTVNLVNGQATVTTSTLAVGTHTVSFTYAGDANFNGSASNALQQVVNQATTTTGLSSSVNPSVFGEPVVLTATVGVPAPGAGSPGGTVSFFDGALLLGTNPLSGTSATITLNGLTLGAHSFTAVYNGDVNFLSSTSPAVSQTVNPATTTTTLMAAPTSTVFGQPLVLTSTVAANLPGMGTPTGTVSFFDGATLLGTGPLSSGSASITVSTLTATTHNLTAVYNGSPAFASSTSTVLVQTVGKADTTVALVSLANPSVVGQPVTFRATVTPSAPGAGIPGSTVTFFDGVINLGTSPVVAGVANLTVSALSLGTHNITAAYNGDSNFNSSTSNVLTQVVNQAGSTTTVTSSLDPSVVGQSVVFTATVSPVAPGSGIPTGSVIFNVDGTNLPAINLDAFGQASFPTAGLSVGNHNIVATYSGDVTFLGSTSPVFTQTVDRAATATALSTNPISTVFGQSVALSATVTVTAPGGGVPTGNVSFFDGAAFVGSAALVGSTATLNTSSLSTGSHTLTAVYNGDFSFLGSTSAAQVQQVNPASTTSTVTANPNPSVVGQAVVFTVTVAAVPPGAGTPAGAVTFFVDGQPQPPVNLNGAGQATLTTSSLGVGGHTITAQYAGNVNFSGSSSVPFAQTVNVGSSTTALSSAVNPSVFGQAVTFTATVAAFAPASGQPTGTVTFFNGATSLGSATLAGGVAMLTTSALTIGNNSVTAVYAGDSNFATSTSPAVTQSVQAAGTTTTMLGASINPSAFGQSVTFTAGVQAVAPGSGTPTGNVTFLIDGVAQPPVALNAAGQAAFSTTSLSVGNHTVAATYGGDGNFTTSTSTTPLTQSVARANATTSIVSSSVNPSVFGQNVVLSATVSATAPGAGNPTGTVSFFDAGILLGSTALSAGAASLTVNTLSVGTHNLTAAYSGDGNFNTSTSATPLLQTVNKAGTTTGTVASSVNPSLLGQAVVFTVNVTATAPGVGSPTGTVTFFDGGTQLGTGTLNNGTATLSKSTLSAGPHSITASYAGNDSFTTSTSATALTQTVNKASTTTSVTPSVNPSVFGQSVSFTATVAAVAPGSGTPTGSVTFTIDGVTSAPVTLVNGSASFATSSLAVGPHVVSATYSGDAGFNTSTSDTLTANVNKANAAATVLSAPNPSVFGQSVTLTATITAAAPGAGAPTGTVTFFDGGQSLGSRTLSAGVATLAINSFTVGTHALTVAYSGDGSFNAATSTVQQQTVGKASTNLAALSVLPNPAAQGQAVTFTATVATVTPGTVTPGGTVTFFANGTSLGQGVLNGSGVATITTNQLSIGQSAITAVYNGDANFNGSGTAQAVTLTVVTLNESFVSRLYIDLLGRAPDPQGLAYWLGQIQSGASRTQVALGFEASTEYQTREVEQLYQELLGRPADSQGLNTFVMALQQGASIRQVEAVILSSNEYYQTQGGGTNAGWLNAVYEDVLGRPVDPQGEATWSLMLAQGTPRIVVATMILNSNESNVDTVMGYYEQYLGRPADQQGLAFWVSLLDQGQPVEQILAGILGSEEYYLQGF